MTPLQALFRAMQPPRRHEQRNQVMNRDNGSAILQMTQQEGMA
jgi:hypothetical protein